MGRFFPDCLVQTPGNPSCFAYADDLQIYDYSAPAKSPESFIVKFIEFV